MREKIGRISETDFLAKLVTETTTEDMLTQFKNKIGLKKYSKRQLIYTGVDNHIFCIARGVVKSFRVTEDGEEIFNDIFYQGDVFGNLLFINGNERFKVISDDADIYFIRSLDLLNLPAPQFLANFLSTLESKISSQESYFLKLMSLAVKERLIYFLENLAKRRGYQRENSVTIECPLTAAEIADSICATRQSVSFHLRELKKSNWLKITGREIELSDYSFERYLRVRMQTQHLAA